MDIGAMAADIEDADFTEMLSRYHRPMVNMAKSAGVVTAVT
jgi:hypothetical protein